MIFYNYIFVHGKSETDITGPVLKSIFSCRAFWISKLLVLELRGLALRMVLTIGFLKPTMVMKFQLCNYWYSYFERAGYNTQVTYSLKVFSGTVTVDSASFSVIIHEVTERRLLLLPLFRSWDVWFKGPNSCLKGGCFILAATSKFFSLSTVGARKFA